MSDFAARVAGLNGSPRVRLMAALGVSLFALPGAALAQAGGGAVSSVSEPVVQSVPGVTGMKLNEVLHRLSRNPTDVPTLLEAGKVSMQIGDPAAAVGFYQRAAKLAPANPNVKAGLAGAYALNDDPLTAINLFNEAERAGPIDPALLAPRGLAYDLVGDNGTAQTYYKQALAAGSDDETVRRLALSQAIGGDRRAMELTLTPLLQKQDKGAWRTRAFALAILGQGTEAESIVRSTMPAQLAEPMAAYLRYMPRLTPPQQAAAANLGQFPRAADIGRDDPRFAAFQRPRATLAAAAPVPAAATRPGAKDQGRTGKRSRDAEVKRDARAAPVVRVASAALPTGSAPVAPLATRETTATPTVTTAPPPAAPKLAAPKPVELPPVQAAAAPPPLAPAAAPVPAPAPAATLAAAPVRAAAPTTSVPGFSSLDTSNPAVRTFDLKPAASVAVATPAVAPAPVPALTPSAASSVVQPPAPAPVPAPAPAAALARPRNLADLFADLAPPSREAEPAAGAVDVRRIAPAIDPKVKAAAEAKAKAEREAKAARDAEAREKAIKASAAAKHPSRVWVQVATGRNKSALGFDWRRFARENPDVFGKRSPFVTAWGQTNRLLTGPFASEKAANAFIAQLKKAGIDGAFSWSSPAGQVVDALGGAK